MDKAEAAKTIDRLRRAMPRNPDVLAVCSIAEAGLRNERPADEPSHRRLSAPARVSERLASITIGDADATSQPDERAQKAAYNAYMRRVMRDRRAKQKAARERHIPS